MELKIGKQFQGVPNVYFSSDWHLSHSNIIQFQNRPFANSEEMDSRIIQNCNETVGEDDALFFLGDWCFHDRRRDECSREELAERYRRMVNCRNIYFVWGNHDKKLRNSDRFCRLWRGTYDLLEIEVDGRRVVLCHYAMRTWNKSHHGYWHLYGHSHGGLADDPALLSFDCGVDCFDFCPVSFSEVSQIMAKKRLAGAGATLHHRA